MDRRLFFVLMMSAATIFAFQHFTRKDIKKQDIEQVQSGQSYRVPSKEEMLKPLNREIDFVDKKIVQKEILTQVETDLCSIEFSSFGGVLSSIEYKKRLGKENTPLKTIHNKDFFHREESCFLLALAEKTPYFYKFISKDDLDDEVMVTYQAEIDDWIINKVYTVSKNTFKLDLEIEFSPKSSKAQPIQGRLFVASPFVGEIPNDTAKAFEFNVKKKAIKVVSAKEVKESAWLTPEIFGTEDRYFANTLVGDEQRFTQRAYFKKVGETSISSIFEGPSIDKKEKWSLSFYVGPKDLEDMTAVDSRLEGLLDFGLLSWVCKLLLKILTLLYGYLHNYGLAIIVLTILIKIPLLPLSMKSADMMERYQKYQPQIARIRKQYKSDSQRMHAEIMRFHKEHNISPATQMIGCLPLLFDLPIIYSLYRVLGNYMDLYNAPFFGWITDLSAKDPYYILPIFMGISMFWQQKLTPAGDGKQKAIMLFMTLFMTVIFANFATGIVLYWFTKNILTIGETYLRRAIIRR